MTNVLKQRGNVMKFAQFINEQMNVGIEKDGVAITPDKDCIKSCWSIIEQECGGDADTLLEYLKTELDIPFPSNRDLIIYIMELVDDYLNNSVTITKGEQYIKHGKMNNFLDAMIHVDYKSVVEQLLMKLFKVDDKTEEIPDFIKDVFKILDDCLI